MIIKRNLLCVKNEENLDLGHLLLYKPYKNIVINLVNLATDKNATDFDPVSKIFDGLESISDDMKDYYEAFLGVTSYYQHSQGGRGKYVEKKISSVMETCSMNIKLSELPLWLEHPELHRKRGIFTQSGLTQEEKSIIRNIHWDWCGRDDETTDIGNLLIDDRTIILVELKNRVDSGGTAGRREIWTKKFKTILDYLSNKTELYRKGKTTYSLSDLLDSFGINSVELYVGILFNVGGDPATKQGDREKGFYSSNVEGYNDLRNFIISNPNLEIIAEDSNNLHLNFNLTDSNIQVKVAAIYGNEIPRSLFRRDYSVNDLLILRYDDIWLSQLLAIDERAFLLKYGKNFMTIIRDLIKGDWDLRQRYDTLIRSECEEAKLKGFIQHLLDRYRNLFEDMLVPPNRDKDEYIGDIVQVLCSADA